MCNNYRYFISFRKCDDTGSTPQKQKIVLTTDAHVQTEVDRILDEFNYSERNRIERDWPYQQLKYSRMLN